MQKNYGYSSNKYLDTKFLKGVPDNFAGKKLVRSAMQTFFDISGGDFKTPQNCQSALFFDLIKGAFFRLRIKLRREKRLLPFPLRIKLRRDKPGSSLQTTLYSSLRMTSL